jgi:aspartate/methionine/tyrosine aminotransferase
LEEIIALAKSKNIIVLSDEVYRPIFHEEEAETPSILSLGYENVISTGSLSKAYALAGIRVGWVASRNKKIIEILHQARHYMTLSVSILDSEVAAFALGPTTVPFLLERNIRLVKTNKELLAKFISDNSESCSWIEPLAGTTAFVKFTRDGHPIDAVEFCQRLIAEVGFLIAPGDYCFGSEFKGYVRIGYVCETEVLKNGLQALQAWFKTNYHTVSLSKA